MPERLEDLLDRCLAARMAGRSAEDFLSDLGPELRRELEPLVEVVDTLRRAPRVALPAGVSADQE